MKEKETHFLTYLVILLRQWKPILIQFFIVCIVAAGISLTLPKWYRAHTTILPPAQEEGLMGLTSSLMGSLPLGGLGIGAVSEETDLFIAILSSRTVMESVAKKFDLQNHYKEKNIEETVRTLRKHIYAKLDDEGMIELGAEARSPFLASKRKIDEARELAMQLANYFIDQLDSVNAELKVERARNTRIFTEKRYLQNLKDLSIAEDNLKAFQEEHGIIALSEQTTVTISAIADLKAQVIAKEVELEVLKQYVGGSHMEIIRVQNELNEVTKKYNEYTNSANIPVSDDDTKTGNDIFLALDIIPELGLQYVRLFRELKIQETILEFLLPQYEEAKIKEAKDTPTVQVLDKAVKPWRKARPKRIIFVIFWGFISLLYSTCRIIYKPAIQAFIEEIKNK